MSFYFLYLGCFDIWGFAGETVSARISQFLTIINDSSLSRNFTPKPTDPSPSALCPLHWAHPQHHCPSAPIVPGTGTSWLGTVLIPEGPVKLSKVGDPKSAQLAVSVPSCHNKGSCPSPSAFSLISGLPLVAPVGWPRSLLLGTGTTSYFVNGSHLLACWLYYIWIIIKLTF